MNLSDPSQSPNWVELPRDVTVTILLRLGAIEILTSAQQVCSTWRKICKDPLMWRTIDMYNPEDHWGMDYDLEKMCRYAVDRSQGELLDIHIEYFGTDELFEYITDRSNAIRRLRLVSCYNISDEVLIDGAAKLPLLEELDLSYCSFSKEALEAVGCSCPLLKSFKLNSQGFRRPHIESDEDAIAIAENMPRLRQLQLFGNKMTDDGLHAILDGCPHLESLDLRQCFNITLGETLREKCEERIKDLRLPNDSTDDYEYDAEIHYDEDYPSEFSDIDLLTDDDDYYEFSDGSEFSDYGEFFYD